jgi:Trk K+ transport system NAD-binding subunit
MRAILVGAGGIGRAVLERLGEHWDVTAVDQDADRLAELAAVRPIQTIVGDGSSRVTLKRAGLDDADAVVVAVRDDEMALEVCRLATAARVDRVVAMVVAASRQPDFTKLGVVAVAPDRLAARQVELTLEPRRVASAAFADGRAEAIEFRLAPDSAVVGRTLAEIGLHGWLIVAVLRGNQLIVPHGGTTLAAGDRVTVVGAAADHAAMVRTFSEGEARFPLAYGRQVGALLPADEEDPTLLEAIAFVRLTAAETLVVVHPRRTALDEEAATRLGERLDGISSAVPHVEFVEGAGEQVSQVDLRRLRAVEHLGCLVIPKPRGLIEARRLLGFTREAAIPVLLASGATRYRSIVIPARDTAGGWDAAWVAFDLAARNDLPVEAVGASTPRFLVSDDDEPVVRAAVARLRDEGSVRGAEVTGLVERGNPVRLFRELDPESLLVLGLGRDAGSILRPGFTALVASRLTGSMLVVPPAVGSG